MAKKALLVMAYGTPYKESDILPYYTHIRHGRQPSDEALQDLKERYEAIGGISPLADTTERQARALLNKLNEQSDDEYELFIGLKHIHPFIEDAVADIHEAGIKNIDTIVLTPHYSAFSVQTYNDRAKEEADKYGITVKSVIDFYRDENFIDYWVEQVENTLNKIDVEEHKDTAIIVSAHSLPEKLITKNNDPYPDQLKETMELIRARVNKGNYHVGWQSEGNTPDPWLGPDVQDLTEDLYNKYKYKHFVYLPLGFVCEHLEVLYDNDYECKVVTDKVGATYHRPPMPNTDDRFIQAMVNEILKL
ncbi:ferrochelatase [Phocicoccus pinnipedialis]|uniref:Coproporphyrin III ferrochelatase n=1 Tax=Phocicoccus pinnipedialis TaxID=110845 RepID=A0A6V7RL93_9BACL|nr:ferrochelatase [Jeotgalicoccus pinnipedialis]MBP1939590.1 ferrochelatase [Jeotgalicoccus pinnipedialis]CAD2079085.1 Ferrochelatase [Jeotgalicoccus pinnipedialis]